MAVYLVRHAKAGKRDGWDGPDHLRPLTAAGRRQAAGLVGQLGATATGPLLSSPYVRCVQTLEPLAAVLGGKVETTDDLSEGTPGPTVVELMLGLPDGAVLCSHGDVIPDVVEALQRRGMDVLGPPNWRKGATWVLERAEGAFARGHALGPVEAPGD